MLRCKKIWDHNPVSTTVSVLQNENDLGVVAAVRKTDFRTKPHGLAGQLLCDHLQAGFDIPARLLGRTVPTSWKRKLLDFSLIVDCYSEGQETARLLEGVLSGADQRVEQLAQFFVFHGHDLKDESP